MLKKKKTKTLNDSIKSASVKSLAKSKTKFLQNSYKITG